MGLQNRVNKAKLLKEMGFDLWYLRARFSEFKAFSPEENQKNKLSLSLGLTNDTPIKKNNEMNSSSKTTEDSIKTTTTLKTYLNWNDLTQSIKSCTACPLHKERKQAVVGYGDEKAQLLIVGEAPGAHEDETGQPFVGRSGKLLDSILLAIGLDRKKIYIANIIKCRPPNNRNPETQEMDECQNFLLEQINFIQPKLIVTLGAISSQYLLKTTEPMARLRQKIHQLVMKGDKNKNQTIDLIASYHPAYLLRDPKQKAKAWQDWKIIREQLKAD